MTEGMGTGLLPNDGGRTYDNILYLVTMYSEIQPFFSYSSKNTRLTHERLTVKVTVHWEYLVVYTTHHLYHLS